MISLSRWRQLGVIIGIVTVIAMVASACSHGPSVAGQGLTDSTSPGQATRPAHLNGPGSSSQILWQAAVASPVVAGSLVVAKMTESNGVVALTAATGVAAWSFTQPGSTPVVTGSITAGPDVVVVPLGVPDQTRAGGSHVTELRILQVRTGQPLWDLPIRGRTPSPPLAFAGGLLIVGDATGVITAYQAQTGVPAWSVKRPLGCGLRGDQRYDEGIAADDPSVAVSYQCADGQVLAQRLKPESGQVSWQWRSPTIIGSGSFLDLAVTAVARDGDVVVMTGQVGFPTFTQRALQSMAHAYTWPSSLGPAGNEIELALDATTGHARWAELGAQQADVSLSDGASCEVVRLGVACRDDVTGALTASPLLTGQSDSVVPPSDDGWAGVSGDLIFTTVGSESADVTVVATTIRGGRTVVTSRLPISNRTTDSARYMTFIGSANPLSGNRTLLLVQRVDVDGYPWIAVSGPAH